MDNYFALFSLYKIGKYKFLAIPKNCSTTLLGMAEKHIVNITNNYDKNTIGIIRDPIDRWIAGQTHMMYRHENQNQFYERFELVLRQILKEEENLKTQPGISAQLIITTLEGNISRYIRSKFKESPSTYIDNIWDLLAISIFKN